MQSISATFHQIPIRRQWQGHRLSGPIAGFATLLAILGLATPSSATEKMTSGPARVVDGDTIDIGPIRIRLKGISAPERRAPGGAHATDALRSMIAGAVVMCRLTGERTHDREVGYCKARGLDLNAEMVRSGWALACPRFDRRYLGLESEPRAQRRGVWAIGYKLPAYCIPKKTLEDRN